MLIFSKFDSKIRFVEISSYEDCRNITADFYVFFRICSSSLDSYLELASKLQQEEIAYAVLVDRNARFDTRELYFDSCIENDYDIVATRSRSYVDKSCSSKANDEFLSLNVLILMFSHLGASFCIIDKKNFSLLPLMQNLVNHYLLDIKILALVDSYIEIQSIAIWKQPNYVEYMQYSLIGIDGIVEKSLLTYKS